jgi:hypothetical protein
LLRPTGGCDFFFLYGRIYKKAWLYWVSIKKIMNKIISAYRIKEIELYMDAELQQRILRLFDSSIIGEAAWVCFRPRNLRDMKAGE